MKKLSGLLTVAGIAGTLAAPAVHSAGFMLNEQSVSSIARGLAGRGVSGDNAADIAANPAGTALFDKQQVSLTLHYIDPNINVKGNHITSQGAIPTKADDVAPSEFVPGAYYVLPIDSNWSFGLSANSYFGMSTEYPSSFSASEMANKTAIKTIYLTPSVAYKYNEMFSFGLGLSYIYGSGEIKNTAPFDLPPEAGGLPKGSTLLDIDGSGSAFGWTIGGMWEINEKSRLGLSYRSQVDLDADADVTSLAKTGGKEGDGTITFNLPDTLELSYFNQLNEQFAVALGIQYIGWSTFENLTIDIDGVGDYMFKEENWEDSFRYSVGMDYRLNSLTNFHFGYTYDESPVPAKYRTLTIPDADRQWLTFGATLDFESAGIVDLAFAYVMGDQVKVKEKSELGTQFDGKLTKVDALIFSFGYSYSF